MTMTRFLSALLLVGATAVSADEPSFEHCINLSLSAGQYNFEGDEAVEDSELIALHLGFDWTEHWTIEGILSIAPDLDENFANHYGERFSRLEAAAGVDDTSAIGLAVDALYHFTRWERLDPYLAAGIGAMWYEDDFDSRTDPALRVGGGLQYHISDQLGLRTDLRVMTAGDDSEANAILSGGVMWTFIKQVDDRGSRPLDSDGDGLFDAREAELGTNPFEADTDFDGLSDGEEVNIHKTNPRQRDTDTGGVADGHEVIEDDTSPLTETDDLMVFELNMQFEKRGAEIKPEYFSDLDAIANVLKNNTDATARIEGHLDATHRGWLGRRRSKKRAQAVQRYFEAHWDIDSDRMQAVGYGATRPRATPDPENGNPANQRIEIYVRGA